MSKYRPLHMGAKLRIPGSFLESPAIYCLQTLIICVNFKVKDKISSSELI